VAYICSRSAVINIVRSRNVRYLSPIPEIEAWKHLLSIDPKATASESLLIATMMDQSLPNTSSLFEAFQANVSNANYIATSFLSPKARGGGAVVPTQNDILMGRGNSNKWHPGNVYFQSTFWKRGTVLLLFECAYLIFLVRLF
jgi:hypothetical protein